MTLVYLSDRRIQGAPDPTEIITVTLGDKTFRSDRRTAAHLEWTIQHLAAEKASAHLHVIQPCLNTGVAASAGTHDGCGVLDVRIDGFTWPAAQEFLREHGWAAWWRHDGEWAAPSAWHVHMASIGCPGPVGIYVPGQVADYYAHRTGLVGHYTDPTWHPADIGSTVFDYPAFLTAKEDDMPYSKDELTAIIKAAVEAEIPTIAKAVIDTPVGKDGDTLGQVVNQVRTAVKKPK